ncbi:hypothetical protein ACH4TX_39225 [Streptomyces sp. NPDC021098]|uniref:hypothetical protein n=1 Tax=unclassified Streptomyces TaxID=2593676 RepID=UPI003795ABF3
MTAPISRRTALRRAAFIAAGTAAGTQLLATPGYAASGTPDPSSARKALERARKRNERVLTGTLSKNGWEKEKLADDRGHIYTRPVPGTPVDIQVRMGDVETVLVHVIRRFHYEIDELRRGDVIGWKSPNAVRKSLPESNQASGTAVQIRPGHYPAGTRGGFFLNQQLVIRDILAQLGGVVRWGGDDRRPDESLFYIDVPPGSERLVETADMIRGWTKTPGEGAGAPVDVRDPQRRRAAATLERRQKTEA